MRIVIAEDSVLLRAGLTRLLVDAGFPPHRIGLWVGTYGLVASIAG